MSSQDSTQHEVVTVRPHADSVVAMGSRREFAARVKDLVERDREFVMERLGGDEAAGEFVDAVRWGVTQRPPDRTCMNIRAAIMKSVEEDAQRVRDVYISIGASSEEEARAKIALANSVEGAGPHDGAERCVAYLEAYLNMFPEQRGAAVKRLGGLVPVEMG